MKSLFLLLILMQALVIHAQKNALPDFNRGKQEINAKGMSIIASWSAANVIYSSIAFSKASGSKEYFHQMNAIWSGVTLGLATFGYFASRKNEELTFGQSLQKQALIEKIFLANAALDVAYITGGFYLQEKAKNVTERDKLQGYGSAIILQGSALLLFDAIMFATHHRHGKDLYHMADNVKIAATRNGIGLTVAL